MRLRLFSCLCSVESLRLPYNANTAQIERRNVTGKNLHYVKLESFFLWGIGQTQCVTFIAGAARFMTSVHCDREQRVPDGIALYLISNVALADAICQPERSILAAGSYSRGKQIAGFFSSSGDGSDFITNLAWLYSIMPGSGCGANCSHSAAARKSTKRTWAAFSWLMFFRADICLIGNDAKIGRV